MKNTRIKYTNKKSLNSNETELINVSIHSSLGSQQPTTITLIEDNQHTLTTRIAATVTFIFILILVVTIFIAKNQLYQEQRDQAKREYSSEYKPVKFFLDHLNQSIDPCHDFHWFSCGKWISQSASETDQFTIAIEKSLDDLAQILDETVLTNDTRSVANLKRFYKSCMNTTESDLYSDVYFWQFMKRKFGQWPMLEKENSAIKHFSLEETIAKLISIRMPLAFRFESIEYKSKMIMKIAGKFIFILK